MSPFSVDKFSNEVTTQILDEKYSSSLLIQKYNSLTHCANHTPLDRTASYGITEIF